MAQTTQAKKKKKRKKRRQSGSPLHLVLVLLVLVALCLTLLIVLFTHTGQEEPLPSPTVSTPPAMPPNTLSAECFGLVNGYKTYVSDQVTAELGLDVSSHQGWIDWNAVAESDVDYVILRAGYRGYGTGEVHQDEYFEYNIASATATDLGVGIYFFSQAINEDEAREEARLILSLIADYDVDYPIFYDWEPVSDPNARTASISTTELTACAKAFCGVIEDAGYEAGVYFNLSMAASFYSMPELLDYELWLAEYQAVPSYPFTFDMWQYTADGSVPGISTNVDLNLSFTSYG